MIFDPSRASRTCQIWQVKFVGDIRSGNQAWLAGKWTIHHISARKLHSVQGFSSQPCLMTPEGNCPIKCHKHNLKSHNKSAFGRVFFLWYQTRNVQSTHLQDKNDAVETAKREYIEEPAGRGLWLRGRIRRREMTLGTEKAHNIHMHPDASSNTFNRLHCNGEEWRYN